MYHLTLEYDENLVRKSVIFFFWKTTGWFFFIALFITFCSFIFLMWSENFSWITGVAGTTLFFASLILITLFLTHYQNGIRKLKNMGIPTAKLTLKNEVFEILTSSGNVTLPWSSITDIWKSESFWLILFAKNDFFTIPLKNIPPEALDFMNSKVKPSPNDREGFYDQSKRLI